MTPYEEIIDDDRNFLHKSKIFPGFGVRNRQQHRLMADNPV